MSLASSIIFIILLFYIMILIFLRVGLCKLRPGRNEHEPSVSIIVAARNEEDHLRSCLKALQAQRYPPQKTEFIIIDDRSTDDTHTIIEEFMEADSRFEGIQIQEEHLDMAPKKWALHRGIQKAGGDIILTTDADCTPPPGWIAAMTRYFEDGVGLVTGFSPIDRVEKPTLLHRLIALDGLALAGVAAGGIGIGMPLTCTGRNLAYRKSVYEDVGGFTSIGRFVSGDDDLFLQLVRRQPKYDTRYAVHPDTFVGSVPPDTFADFFHQRTRHASKGFHYQTWLTMSLIVVYLLNLILLIGWMVPGLWLTWMAALMLKVAFEYLFMVKTTSLFQKSKLLRYFPLAALFHIPYVVIFGLWAQFGTFRWKGQAHNKIQKGANTE